MKIGLFFGSFNPIHIGHLIIANTMAEHTDLQQVWLVVSPQNPFKKNNNLLHEQDRYDMVKLAIADSYVLNVSDIEFQLPRPSYTCDTLAEFRKRYPQHEFVLIIGGDNLAAFPNWKEYEQILAHHKLYVYPRPGDSYSRIDDHPNVKKIKAPLMDISATYIRQCVQENKSIHFLVTQQVENFIKAKKFYI